MAQSWRFFMKEHVKELLGKKMIEIKKASQSDTWCGGDFDYECDNYLVAYLQEEDGFAFIYHYMNSLEHSMDDFYNFEYVKCGYYKKDGTPVAANVLFDFCDIDGYVPMVLDSLIKVKNQNTIVFNKPNISNAIPKLIGTYEKDGQVYSGKFKDGKLHGFGFVANRTPDGIELVKVGIFDNGELLEEGPASFHHVSLINKSKLYGYTFKNFLEAKESTGDECYFNPKLIAGAFK